MYRKDSEVKNEQKRSHERKSVWATLRNSAHLRTLADMLTGPYWPRSGRVEQRSPLARRDTSAQRQVLLGEARRFHLPASAEVRIKRREWMLDDALDDSFPASDPPAFVAPVSSAWR